MSGFDYANARLRALKSRLLPRAALEALAETGSIRGLLLALTDTAYRAPAQAVLAQAPPGAVEAHWLAEALRVDLLNTLGRVRGFFSASDEAGPLAAVVFGRYDVHNVKAVLRGLARQAPAAEIVASTMPIGDLGPAELARLAGSARVSAALDLLATWCLPLAQPLLAWRASANDHPLDLAHMEVALERWRLLDALEAAEAAGANGAALQRALRREADAANALTALRLASMAKRSLLDTQLFAGPGFVPVALVLESASRPSVEQAVRAWERTAYGPALTATLPEYEATRRLSVFERALSRLDQHVLMREAIEDALGIGVLLAYIALKRNEIANLRAIAHGLALGAALDELLAELLLD
ncbi:MAG: V-type ATPase subunit [Anaerolineales bacterium]|nr:V-type ATPase subunit [Anaerolineales bacterium]